MPSVDLSSFPYHLVPDVSNLTFDNPTGGTSITAALLAATTAYDGHTCPTLEFAWHGSAVAHAGYLMATPLLLRRKVHFKGQSPRDIRFSTTTIYAPAGVTPFILESPTAADSSQASDSLFEGIRFAAIGMLTTRRTVTVDAEVTEVGPPKLRRPSFTLTGVTLGTGDIEHDHTTVGTVTTYTPVSVSDADDFTVDQIVGIEGCGQAHELQRVFATTVDGTAAVTVIREGHAAGSFGGLHVGAFITIAGAYASPTRVVSYVFDTVGDSLILTMASNAAATLDTPTAVNYYTDHICRILSKSGSGSLAVYTVDSSFAGCLTGVDRRMYHADTAIYAGARFTALRCSFGGVNTGWAGAGLTINASVGNAESLPRTQPPPFGVGTTANYWRLENCEFQGSRFGLYVFGSDTNVGTNISPVFNDTRLWNEIQYSAAGCTTVGAHYKGGYGLLTRDNGPTANLSVNSYAEGGTYSSLGAEAGAGLIGGQMFVDGGGYSMVSGYINRLTIGEVAEGNAYSSHSTQFFPKRWFARYRTVLDPIGMGFKLLLGGEDAVVGAPPGMIGYSHLSGSGRIPFIITMSDSTYAAMTDKCQNAGHLIVPRGMFLGGDTVGAPDVRGARYFAMGSLNATPAPATNIRSWVVGDRIYNDRTDAANNAIDFWRCTVAGDPGTWVAVLE